MDDFKKLACELFDVVMEEHTLLAVAVHKCFAEGILTSIELVVGFFDFLIFFVSRLKAGTLDKLRHHHN